MEKKKTTTHQDLLFLSSLFILSISFEFRQFIPFYAPPLDLFCGEFLSYHFLYDDIFFFLRSESRRKNIKSKTGKSIQKTTTLDFLLEMI